MNLAERLRHVYWIGGSPGAGKSTIARGLAVHHGWHLYVTDDTMPDHAGRTTPRQAPFLHDFLAMDMDERWVDRSPRTMFETFHWYRGEGFDLIVEDLLRLPQDRPVIAEGFRLLPHLVRPLLPTAHHAVWLLPTPGFRETAVSGRSAPGEGFIWRTSDPEKAARNLAERDAMFVERLERETSRLHLPVIRVDVTMTEEELRGRVGGVFGL
ncbi:hypothetical protein [Streptomyces acidiscabies]|uniref:hypothetical protein n=1 Tax=Streptomyces acidiscabies TaxID=42234 RepID=UPI0038F79EA0